MINFPSFRFPVSRILRRPWWIKIQTQSPACTYYFGPFESEAEAERSKPDYVNDLLQEDAQGITTEIKQIRPKTLTIDDDAS